jgi:hypothetical protein
MQMRPLLLIVIIVVCLLAVYIFYAKTSADKIPPNPPTVPDYEKIKLRTVDTTAAASAVYSLAVQYDVISKALLASCSGLVNNLADNASEPTNLIRLFGTIKGGVVCERFKAQIKPPPTAFAPKEIDYAQAIKIVKQISDNCTEAATNIATGLKNLKKCDWTKPEAVIQASSLIQKTALEFGTFSSTPQYITMIVSANLDTFLSVAEQGFDRVCDTNAKQFYCGTIVGKLALLANRIAEISAGVAALHPVSQRILLSFVQLTKIIIRQ